MSDERHVYIGGWAAEADLYARQAGLGRNAVVGSPTGLRGRRAKGLVIHLVGTFYLRHPREVYEWLREIEVLEFSGAKVVFR